MGQPFAVDLDQLHAFTDRMAAVDKVLQHQLDDLEQRILRLHRTWTGDAATAQKKAHDEWMAGAHEMRSALVALRSIGLTAHTNYAAAVTTNTEMWNF